MSILADLVPDEIRGIRRAEYDRMVDSGALEDERIELLQGIIVRMSPQGSPHAWSIRRLNTILVPALLGRAEVQQQLPLALGDWSEPEPDISVVPVVESSRAHPTRAFLVVEVAHSSLRIDLRVKVPIYAAAGVPEVWVVDVVRGVVHVHREPREGEFATVFEAGREDRLTLVAFPDVSVGVADFIDFER